MFDKLCLNETLLVKSLLVLENLDSYIFFLFVIITLQNNSKTSFTALFDDFVSKSKMLIHSYYVLILIIVESIICCFIKHSHLRLCPTRVGVHSAILLLLSLLNREEVYCLVLE